MNINLSNSEEVIKTRGAIISLANHCFEQLGMEKSTILATMIAQTALDSISDCVMAMHRAEKSQRERA